MYTFSAASSLSLQELFENEQMGFAKRVREIGRMFLKTILDIMLYLCILNKLDLYFLFKSPSKIVN